MAFQDNYGESLADRLGGPHNSWEVGPDDEEENDMAVECGHMVEFDGQQYACGTLIEAIATCIFCDDCTSRVEDDARTSEA